MEPNNQPPDLNLPQLTGDSNGTKSASQASGQAIEVVNEPMAVWVRRVGSVFNKYTGNPYQQTEQINGLKSVFLKNRFNKLLKVKPND